MGPRKTRKNKRKQSRKHRGGKELSRGQYGLVYMPPLKCSDNEAKYDTQYISKIFTTEDNGVDGLYKEYANGLLVKELDPSGSWSITPELLCPLDKTQDNANFLMKRVGKYKHQIVYRHGGVTLESLRLRIGEWDEYEKSGQIDERPYDVAAFKLYVSLFKQVLTLLPKLHVRYIHGDFHTNNILYNPEDGQLRMIDFGRLESIQDNVNKLISRATEQKPVDYYIDTVKQIDYAKIFSYIDADVWSFDDKKSLPAPFFAEWKQTISMNILYTRHKGTVTCQMYIDAINALPDLP